MAWSIIVYNLELPTRYGSSLLYLIYICVTVASLVAFFSVVFEELFIRSFSLPRNTIKRGVSKISISNLGPLVSALGIYYVWRSQKIYTFIFNCFMFISLSIGVIATGSRAGTASFLLGTVIFTVYLLKNARNMSRIIVTISLLPACLILLQKYDFYFLRRLSEFENYGFDQLGLRPQSWRIAFENFLESPLFGKGISTVYQRGYDLSFISDISYPRIRILIDGEESLYEPHNTYLTILSELGISGLVAFLCILYKPFSSYLYNSSSLSFQLRTLIVSALCGLTALITSLFFNTRLVRQTIRTDLIIWLFVGIVIALATSTFKYD